MELESPKASPAVLIVGVDNRFWPELESWCRRAGFLADRASNRDEALAAFLRRGGHDGLLYFGSEDERRELEQMLRAVDPELAVCARASSDGFRESDLHDLIRQS